MVRLMRRTPKRSSRPLGRNPRFKFLTNPLVRQGSAKRMPCVLACAACHEISLAEDVVANNTRVNVFRHSYSSPIGHVAQIDASLEPHESMPHIAKRGAEVTVTGMHESQTAVRWAT